ncbi:MAG: hypothetical protein KY432_01365 [Acidobacteria bacterium]|nr:hypothetical protein [Acidobacteriota bacterium]
MKYDRKNVNDRTEANDDSMNDTREALERPTSMHEGGDAPSQKSQTVPFAPPDKGKGKDEQVERALEDLEVDYRREDKETNKSEDPRIGTHDREYSK